MVNVFKSRTVLWIQNVMLENPISINTLTNKTIKKYFILFFLFSFYQYEYLHCSFTLSVSAWVSFKRQMNSCAVKFVCLSHFLNLEKPQMYIINEFPIEVTPFASPKMSRRVTLLQTKKSNITSNKWWYSASFHTEWSDAYGITEILVYKHKKTTFSKFLR